MSPTTYNTKAEIFMPEKGKSESFKHERGAVLQFDSAQVNRNDVCSLDVEYSNRNGPFAEIQRLFGSWILSNDRQYLY